MVATSLVLQVRQSGFCTTLFLLLSFDNWRGNDLRFTLSLSGGLLVGALGGALSGVAFTIFSRRLPAILGTFSLPKGRE